MLLVLLLMASTLVGGEEQCDLAKGGACLGGMRVNWLVDYKLLYIDIQLLDINWKLRMAYPLPKPMNTNLSFIMILG